MDNNVIDIVKGAGAKGLKVTNIIVLLFIILIVALFMNPFVIVGAGERGVVLNFGAVQSSVLGEGLHMRIPIMQRIIKLDVKVHKSQTDAESVSKDLQDTR